MKRSLLLHTILLFHISSYGQARDFLFKSIDINRGLSQNSVVSTAIDSLGFVWLATQDGLNRFDGRSFLKFPFTFDDITTSYGNTLGKLACGTKTMWMITSGGKLTEMNLLTYATTAFRMPGTGRELQLHANCLLPDRNDNLWIGTTDGLYYCDFAADTTYYYQQFGNRVLARVLSLFRDRGDTIRVLGQYGLFSFGPDRKIISSKTYKDVPLSVLARDAQSVYWAGTFGSGLLKKEKGSENFTRFSGYGKDSLPSDLVVYTLATDREGRIWAGTYGNGLYIIDSRDSAIHHVVYEAGNPFSLGFNDVLCVLHDRKDGIWIGTDGGGVSYYADQLNLFRQITGRNVPAGISIDQVRSVLKDNQGTIWLGTSGKGLTGINLADKLYRTFNLRPFKSGISNYNRIVSLYNEDKDQLWVGTQGNGLLLLRKKDGHVDKWYHTASRPAIPGNTIWTILPESGTRLWIGTRYAGLCLVNKDSGIAQQYLADGLPGSIAENSVRAIVRGNGQDLYVGLESRGIQAFNRQTRRFTPVAAGALQRLLRDETSIKCLYYQRPWLLAGTSGKGLLVINTTTNSVNVITEKEGLSNNTVYGILPESDSVIWVSTNRGICRVQFNRGYQHPSDLKLDYFTSEDGLQSNEFNTGAYYQAPGGEMFFGGIKGLNIFTPSDSVHRKADFPVYVTSVLIDNLPLESDTLVAFRKMLRFGYRKNSIAFTYSALDYVSPWKLNYEYKLVNYDDEWIDAGSRTYAAYTNLPPGNYSFRVRVRGNGSSGTGNQELLIMISTPFWKRWWFIGITAISVALILYGFYRYRINQLLQVQGIRNRISADLHDDIGSRLTNIQMLSAISKQRLRADEGVHTNLDRIDDEVHASSEALDEIVWNMKVRDNAVENITARIRRYASEVFEKDELSYTLDVNDEFQGRKMAMEKRRDLFLIYREILNNIRKHAAAHQVHIRVADENGNFMLQIGDDGKGFEESVPPVGNGLGNIRQRAARWGGTVTISSVKGKGTTVKVVLPFEKKSFMDRILGAKT